MISGPPPARVTQRRAWRLRFQPHLLTPAVAIRVCAAAGLTTLRLVIEHASGLVGYFIVDTVLSAHERGRYAERGFAFAQGGGHLFAPPVNEQWQDKVVAPLTMSCILAACWGWVARSLVLMRSGQATNARAIAFHEKFGLIGHRGYRTDDFNHDMRLLLTKLAHDHC